MVKVSVIIPVYNNEAYLEECLNSVINQTLDDLEIICIDDGSTDKSLNILNEFSNKYEFIKVFSGENQGAANARNKALKHATGEYVAYLDSDDIFIDKNALKFMYDSGTVLDFDMVSANLKVITYDGSLIKNYNLERFDTVKIISAEDYGIPWSFYKNLFKRSFLVDNNFNFPDYERGEDPVFLAEVLSHINEFLALPVDLYGYRDPLEDGLLKIDNYDKVYGYVKHFKDCFDIFNKSEYYLMSRRYEERLIEFIKARKDLDYVKDVIFDIFEDDEKLLSKLYPKISVLIPVYNVSEFLHESIASLLDQTMKEIELICVNDGSKDNSLDILLEFSRQDARVRVIDKPNGGCGSARNRALDEASGDYIYFFDPDDYVLPNALEELYDNALSNQSELVMFKVAMFMDGQPIDYSTPMYNFDEVFTDVDFNHFTFTYHDIPRYVMNSAFAPWTKLYKKEFLDRYDDFRFDLGVAFDDVPFHVKTVLRAKSISFAPDYYYHYRYANPNSVNNTASNGIDIMRIVELVEEFIKKEGYFEEFKEEFYLFKTNQITMYMLSTHSERYFQLAKKNLLEIDYNDIKHIPRRILQKYYWTIHSDSFKEYKLKSKINDLEARNQRIYRKNRKLFLRNNKLSKEIEDINEENKEMMTSNSWRITKPLRRFK